MSFTNFCDVFASVHEEGFNRIVRHLTQQRPSLFHYGTLSFVKNPKLLCCGIGEVHPEVIKRGNLLVTPMPYLPIPGYPGDAGIEFNFSLQRLEIDFTPTNVFELPPELNGKLKDQSFALRAIVCGGIACPDSRYLDEFVIYPEPYRPDRDIKRGTVPQFSVDIHTPKRGLPFNEKTLQCFQLELFVVLNFVRDETTGEPVLGIALQNLELVDIKPDALESSMECYMKTTLKLGILPQIRIAFNALAYEIGDFITIAATPVSADVPFNPSVENDTLAVFFNLETP